MIMSETWISLGRRNKINLMAGPWVGRDKKRMIILGVDEKEGYTERI